MGKPKLNNELHTHDRIETGHAEAKIVIRDKVLS